MSDYDITADGIIIPPAPTTTTTEYCDPGTDREKHKVYIADMLGVGPDHAVTREELSRRLGISTRRVAARVHDERVDKERAADIVICSTPDPDKKGYYLPSCREDVEEFIATMTSRGKNTFAAIRFAKQYLRDHYGDDNTTGGGE